MSRRRRNEAAIAVGSSTLITARQTDPIVRLCAKSRLSEERDCRPKFFGESLDELAKARIAVDECSTIEERALCVVERAERRFVHVFG